MGGRLKESSILEKVGLPLPEGGCLALPEVHFFWLHQRRGKGVNRLKLNPVEPYPPLAIKSVPALEGQFFIQLRGLVFCLSNTFTKSM